jgi:pimeloyl-ACP methyl ester carboxylesterase
MTYYRAAEYLCSPKDKRAFPLWDASRKSFHKACLLFNPPIQVVEIPFEGGIMPGYFWRPALDDKKRPTLVSVGGNDDSGEETFLWNGPAAVRRGYNYFTFEFPGHRGCVHLNPRMVKQPDYEKPFSAAIDFLKDQKGLDERIALAGHSHGGYAVCRAAIHDKRIKAIIPSTPLIDADAAGAKMFSIINKLPDFLIKFLISLKFRKKPEVKVLLEYVAWTLGYDSIWTALKDPNRPQFNFKGEEHKINCAVLALIGENEGEELMKQTKEFMSLITSEYKELKIFTLKEDGSDDHCQLDNRIRANQVIFDWLDKLFRHY